MTNHICHDIIACMKVIALILSGGVGSRISSDIPKQYIKAAGRMVITQCLLSVVDCGLFTDLFITADKKYRDAIVKEAKEQIGEVFTEIFRGFSDPGETRQLSVFNGLKMMEALAGPSDRVIVHDAARPFVSKKLLEECIEGLSSHDGVMPVLPMKDTVYMSEDGSQISSLLERQKIFAGQAPEGFIFEKYLRANERLMPRDILKINGASEPAVMAGMKVRLIPGDEANFKITTDEDLKRYREILKSKGDKG